MGFLLKMLDCVPSSWIRGAAAVRGRSAVIKSMTNWLPNMLRNQDGRIQKGLGRGLRFNSGNSAVGFMLGTHDLEVQYVLSRLIQAGMTVYDLGANVGFTAILAAKCAGPEGRVICFEPLAANADQIQLNARLNNFATIQVHQVALGKADGEAEFHLSEAPTWGRLAEAGVTPRQSGVIKVPVRSLDSLLARENLPVPQFIKMDVEGAEAAALMGAATLLKTARPALIIELHHTFQAVSEVLTDFGYLVCPVPGTSDSLGTEGELQILAYPRERPELTAVCDHLAAGNKLEFE